MSSSCLSNSLRSWWVSFCDNCLSSLKPPMRCTSSLPHWVWSEKDFMAFTIKGTSALVSLPSQCVKQVAPLPVCLRTTMWQVVASSEPRMEMEPSFGEVTASSLCWTYRRPWGPTCWTDWPLRSLALSCLIKKKNKIVMEISEDWVTR